MVKILKSQPDYIKTTLKLSPLTLQLRDELKKANDPIPSPKVLPKIYENNYQAFEKSLLELKNTYENFLHTFNRNILKYFKYTSSEKI